MKKSVLFFAALMCMMLQTMSMSAHDRIIPAEQLPAAAKAFIQKTFPGQTITYATIDFDGRRTYEVYLSNGFEVEFDKSGTWDKVDCNFEEVPAQLIPTAIANYVNANFANTDIVKIDKERYGYEVKLSNDLDLKFNRKGQLMEIDD